MVNPSGNVRLDFGAFLILTELLEWCQSNCSICPNAVLALVLMLIGDT